MKKKHDISNLDDIKELVDTFYGKVREDGMLAPVFNARIQDRWPEHLEKMYRFWQTVLLEEHTYFGSPFVPHATLEIEHRHFQQWLKLFNQTIEELFEGPIARDASWRADKMALMFEKKRSYIQKNGLSNLH